MFFFIIFSIQLQYFFPRLITPLKYAIHGYYHFSIPAPRLGLGADDHRQRGEGRPPGDAGGRRHEAAAGREVEDLRQGQCLQYL